MHLFLRLMIRRQEEKQNTLCNFCELYPKKEKITKNSTSSLPNPQRTTIKNLNFGQVKLVL